MFPLRGSARQDNEVVLDIGDVFESYLFNASSSGVFISSLPMGGGGLEEVHTAQSTGNGDLVYFKGAWYCIGTSSRIRKSTDDGETWTTVYDIPTVEGFTPNYLKLACTDDYIMFIAKVAAVTTGATRKSVDGTTWTSVTSPAWAAADTILSLAGGSGHFITVFYNATTKSNIRYMLDTASAFSALTTKTDASVDVHKIVNGRYFFVGNDSDLSFSVPGFTQNTITGPGASTCEDVAWDAVNSKFIYLTGTAVYTATNGYTFTATTSLPTACQALAVTGSGILAMGQLGDYYTTNAGTSWTFCSVSHEADPVYTEVASNGNKILAADGIEGLTLLDPAAPESGHGMTWLRQRFTDGSALTYPTIMDTRRGSSRRLISSTTALQTTEIQGVTSFTDVGPFSKFTAGGTGGSRAAAYTFKEAPRFFQVIEYNGNGAAGRSIPHDLEVEPGFIIVKCHNTAATSWMCWHKDAGSAFYLSGNGLTGTAHFGTMTDTSIVVNSVGTTDNINQGGKAYVMYVFAHDPSPDGLIYCGTYNGNASTDGPLVSLGWEPQFVGVKCISSIGSTSFVAFDEKRGMGYTRGAPLEMGVTSTESESLAYLTARANGFRPMNTDSRTNASATYVYVAVRRESLVPTTIGQVFHIAARTGSGAANQISQGTIKYADMVLTKNRASAAWNLQDRVGNYQHSLNTTTAAVASDSNRVTAFLETGISTGGDTLTDSSGANFINYIFKRAESFYDQLQYTGTGSAGQTHAHNLNAVPGMMWVKRLDAISAWRVYYGDATKYLDLSTTAAAVTSSTIWNDTAPTNAVFTLGNDSTTGGSSRFANYLFGTLPGFSKIGTYSGAGVGTIKQVDCGFVAGARFIMIKRIDSTGDWYVFDTVRGIIAGNDPYVLLNSSAAEVTSTDYLDPYSPGFELSVNAPSALNDIAGTYLYWAIA